MIYIDVKYLSGRMPKMLPVAESARMDVTELTTFLTVARAGAITAAAAPAQAACR